MKKLLWCLLPLVVPFAIVAIFLGACSIALLAIIGDALCPPEGWYKSSIAS